MDCRGSLVVPDKTRSRPLDRGGLGPSSVSLLDRCPIPFAGCLSEGFEGRSDVVWSDGRGRKPSRLLIQVKSLPVGFGVLRFLVWSVRRSCLPGWGPPDWWAGRYPVVDSLGEGPFHD